MHFFPKKIEQHFNRFDENQTLAISKIKLPHVAVKLTNRWPAICTLVGRLFYVNYFG